MKRVVASVRSLCGHWTLVWGVSSVWVAYLQQGDCAGCELHKELRA